MVTRIVVQNDPSRNALQSCIGRIEIPHHRTLHRRSDRTSTNDSKENLGMAPRNVADIMKTIKLLRRENAELREDKDRSPGEVVNLHE